MPNTRPDLHFDENNVCDACRSAKDKKENIDWDKRKKDFEELLDSFGNKSSSKYDCLIPVSGGKDSHLTLYYAKNVYGNKKIFQNVTYLHFSHDGASHPTLWKFHIVGTFFETHHA